MSFMGALSALKDSIIPRNADTKDAVPQDNKDEAMPPAVPAPPYRHAAPSGPWPWMDFGHVDTKSPPTAVTIVTTGAATEKSDATTDASAAAKWPGYPQSLFGNWTPDQVGRSQMIEKCSRSQTSTIYWVDVLDNGKFNTPDMTVPTTKDSENDFWNMLQGERPEGIRVRSLFVDNLTPSVLRMLGTKYNIEPFFFTSSINWIPSRYQEAPTHGKGDHITITLPFVRTHKSQPQSRGSPTPSDNTDTRINTRINTQAPFPMSNGDMLFIDLLAIHMVRDVKTNTIISYHPESTWCQTSAKHLHALTRLVGESVYWQIIFSKTKDPTFLFLAILWYALYAWDESFELLYTHVSELESEVLHDSRIELTRKLHVLQAHLLHYQSLLHNFKISVSFIQDTPNPAMESFTEEERTASKEVMDKESRNLLSEIDRLEKRREMLSSRLKNVMDLAFATVNIEDSRQTRVLTEATVRDSAAMKQISYLTMIFLPASFIASVFGMNVAEINPGSIETLAHYAETTIMLTLLTVYVVITFQTQTSFHEKDAKFHQRAAWPYLFLRRWIQEKRTGAKSRKMKSVGDMV